MKHAEIRAQIVEAIGAVDDGYLDWAKHKLEALAEHYAPPTADDVQAAKVYRAMCDAKLTADSIAAVTGLSRATVYASRYRLADQGKVVRVPAGSSCRWVVR